MLADHFGWQNHQADVVQGSRFSVQRPEPTPPSWTLTLEFPGCIGPARPIWDFGFSPQSALISKMHFAMHRLEPKLRRALGSAFISQQSRRQLTKSETFPSLETLPINGGVCLPISRLIRGSALTNAAAISCLLKFT